MHSPKCKLIRVGWFKHCLLFKDIHFVWLMTSTVLVNDVVKKF